MKRFLTPSPALLFVRVVMKTLATLVALTMLVLVLNLGFRFLPWKIPAELWAGLVALLCWLAVCALTKNPYLNWRNQLFYGIIKVDWDEQSKVFFGEICLDYLYRSHRIEFEVTILQENGKGINLSKKFMNGVHNGVMIPFKISQLKSCPVAIVLRDENYGREEKVFLDGAVV